MKKQSLLYLFLLLIACPVLKGQDTTTAYGNQIRYSVGLSRIVRYYQGDTMYYPNGMAEPHYAHSLAYDRQLLPWLDVGVYICYSKDLGEMMTMNLFGTGAEMKIHPIKVFIKRPIKVDVYGFVRGGASYVYMTNLSHDFLQQLEQQGGSTKEFNEWHGLCSPGCGISFGKGRFNVLFEYSKDKCFQAMYQMGFGWKF